MSSGTDASHKVIILLGLGNVGTKYSKTRHNAGASSVAQYRGSDTSKTEVQASCEIAKCVRSDGLAVYCVSPLLPMNLNGQSLDSALRVIADSSNAELVVAYDDMDLPVGTLRVRKKGSAGGHRGVEDVLRLLPHRPFYRVRIGIGRPQPGVAVPHHVLGRLPAEEFEKLTAHAKECLHALVEALGAGQESAVQAVMQRFNSKAGTALTAPQPSKDETLGNTKQPGSEGRGRKTAPLLEVESAAKRSRGS